MTGNTIACPKVFTDIDIELLMLDWFGADNKPGETKATEATHEYLKGWLRMMDGYSITENDLSLIAGAFRDGYLSAHRQNITIN